MKNKKNKTRSTATLTKNVTHKRFIVCESCELQCAGRGGGESTADGRCFCYDGTIIECAGEK